MKQSQFEQQHHSAWQHFTQQLDTLERGKADSASSEHFAANYRSLCQQLALAQSRGYSSHLIEQLQQWVLRGHQQLYRHRSPLAGQLIGFILAGFPRLVRAQWRFVLAASLLFFGSLLLTAALVYGFNDLVYAVLPSDQVSQMEAMYDPAAEHIGRSVERGSSADWMMFGYYIMNNIGIAFQTFASGVLMGIGSLFYLVYNGLVIGAVAGHLSQIGFGQTFWSFVIGHGAFELTAIALAGAAGLKLGWALLVPGRYSRGEALRLAAQVSVRLIGGVIGMLLIAAFVEAYWSSTRAISAEVKYAVGALFWLLVLTYFARAGRGQHAAE